MNKIFLLFVYLFFLASCLDAEDTASVKNSAIWKSSTQSKQWQDMPEIKMTEDTTSSIIINTKSLKQKIDGFGGAFNEKGWTALSLLSPEKKEEALKALFDQETGAKFNICRIPIGSSDYAESRYTLDEIKNDFKMEKFSIERDMKELIPYIKAAMHYKPDMKFWASAWTPPTWMKTNEGFDGGNMKNDNAIYDAYALYLMKFIEAYKTENIDIFAVAIQNEPRIMTNYPSCLWEPVQFLEFIKNHIGPLFEKNNLFGRIMLGTLQDGVYSDYPSMVLSDPKANSYIRYIGFQWDGLNSVSKTRENFPDKNIIQTETECGNWHWKPGFDPNKPQNDWKYAVYTWNKVKDFFDRGVNSYLIWNMILDEEGKSIDAVHPWPQNAAIVIDRKTNEIIYTPMYYAFKHFSYFVKPGAQYARITKGDKNTIAFVNPDGEIVVILQNDTDKSLKTSIGAGKYTVSLTMPAMSWNTIVIPTTR